MTSDVDAIAWLPNQLSSGQTSATVQPDVSWGDWRCECVCDTPAASVRSTGFRSGLLGDKLFAP